MSTWRASLTSLAWQIQAKLNLNLKQSHPQPHRFDDQQVNKKMINMAFLPIHKCVIYIYIFNNGPLLPSRMLAILNLESVKESIQRWLEQDIGVSLSNVEKESKALSRSANTT